MCRAAGFDLISSEWEICQNRLKLWLLHKQETSLAVSGDSVQTAEQKRENRGSKISVVRRVYFQSFEVPDAWCRELCSAGVTVFKESAARSTFLKVKQFV